MNGLLFDIQRFCVHDGPGIRTTVFFKGCPLSCLWCHNPESQRSIPQLRYVDTSCVRCGLCVQACPHGVHKIDGVHHLYFERCIACGQCEAACPADALTIQGQQWSLDEVVALVLRDRSYYGTNGGVTLSGGEPMQQADFSAMLGKALHSFGIHVALDTCGFCTKEALDLVLPYVDLVLFDIKHMDSESHKRLTGIENDRILDNFKSIVKRGKRVCVRIPIIPGYNDGDNLERTAEFLSQYPEVQVELLPYHRYGTSKYQQMGEPYSLKDCQPPSGETMQNYCRMFEKKGIALVSAR